jgi:hypothetical protein
VVGWDAACAVQLDYLEAYRRKSQLPMNKKKKRVANKMAIHLVASPRTALTLFRAFAE